MLFKIEAPETQKVIVHIIDPEPSRLTRTARSIYESGYHAEIYSSLDDFTLHHISSGIVLLHAAVGEDAVQILTERLVRRGEWFPIIVADETAEIRHVVRAIKCGALDYLKLPLASPDTLREVVEKLQPEIERSRVTRERAARARALVERLSAREKEVLERLASGFSNKAIARDLDISPRTVEIHRMKMMGKLNARNASDVVRLRLEAGDFDRIAA